MKWREADRPTITRILRNPAYAGVYRYGLTEADPASVWSNGQPRRTRRPAKDWVWIEDHHEGYVPLTVWTSIQKRLTENRNIRQSLNGAGDSLPAFAGKGNALCQGLLVCRVHHSRFRVKYSDRVRTAGPSDGKRAATYRCTPALEDPDAEHCGEVAAVFVDPIIEAEVLSVLQPPSLEEIRAAAPKEQREHEARLRAREAELHQFRRKITSLEQELADTTDAEPRYRKRLRERIETALAEEESIEMFHRQHPLPPPPGVTDAEFAQIENLLADLSRLWRHPSVTPQQRKQVIRTVITAIHVTPSVNEWTLEVEWIDGTRTCHPLLTHQGTRALIEREYRGGSSFQEIATLLNSGGIVLRAGPRQGIAFSAYNVRRVLLGVGLHKTLVAEAAPLISERYLASSTAGAIAQELNQRQMRHWRGAWTASRVLDVVGLLRRGAFPRIPPLPRLGSFDARLCALHEAGLFPRDIATTLAGEGFRNRTRSPVTYTTVLNRFQKLGLKANSRRHVEAVVKRLTEWAGRMTTSEIAARLNALNLRTIRGKPWTEPIVRLRLASLGLATTARRSVVDVMKDRAPVLTTRELTEELNALGLRNFHGAPWTEETLRRRLTLLGLAYRRRRRAAAGARRTP